MSRGESCAHVRGERLRQRIEEPEDAQAREGGAARWPLANDLEVVEALNLRNEEVLAEREAQLKAAEDRCALVWPARDEPEELRKAVYSGVAAALKETSQCPVLGGLSPWCTRNANVCPECSKQSLLHTGTTFRPETYDQFEACEAHRLSEQRGRHVRRQVPVPPPRL